MSFEQLATVSAPPNPFPRPLAGVVGRERTSSTLTSWSHERELIRRLEAGSEDAYASLLRLHGGRMLAVARRLLGNDDDAQDALQDALISVFRSIRRFNGNCSLGTWLHRIATNAALMKLRTARRRPEASIEDLLPRFSEDGRHREPVSEWPSVEDMLSSDERRALVTRCLDRLPSRYRAVVTLRDIEELSTEETALRLGITPNAAKIRLHRARLALRELLVRELGETTN